MFEESNYDLVMGLYNMSLMFSNNISSTISNEIFANVSISWQTYYRSVRLVWFSQPVHLARYPTYHIHENVKLNETGFIC